MSFATFLLFLAGGAALLASWVTTRFPGWSPSRLRQALVHFTISLTLVWTVPNAIGPVAGGGPFLAVAAVFLLLLPALVYACLSAGWVLKLTHDAVAQ